MSNRGVSFVYADDGKTETHRFVASGSNRVYKTIDDIPDNLAHAFVAIEDERFYKHNGIDLQGIAPSCCVSVLAPCSEPVSVETAARAIPCKSIPLCL